MDEADLIELTVMYRDAIGADAMNVTAVCMSFLAAVYLVGDKLSKAWAFALATIYTMFMIAPIASALGMISERKLLTAKYVELYPEGVMAAEFLEFSTSSATYYFVGSPLILGWFLSLLYLFFRVKGSA